MTEERSRWLPGNGEMIPLVHAHDRAATPLGPIRGWPQSLRAAVDLVLGSPLAMIVLWGPDLIQVYNDAYRAIMAEKHPAGLGQPTRACWPEVWSFNAPIYEAVLRGEARSFKAQKLTILRHGTAQDAFFDLAYSPLRDGPDQVRPQGGIAGVLVTVIEVTERVRSEQQLHDSEARFRAFVTATSDVVYRLSPDWSEMRQLHGRGFLANTMEPSNSWLGRYIHPDDQPTVRAAIERAVRDRSPFELEHRVHRADGSLGWARSRAAPVFDNHGKIIEWLGAARDVTARREEQEALRASEERQGFLLKLSDALRPLDEPYAIQREASRLLGQRLGAIRVAYAEMRPDDRTCTLLAESVVDEAFTLVGMVADWDDFDPVALAASRRGETFSRRDLQAADDLIAEQKATFASLNVHGFINTPLVKAGRLVAFFVAQFDAPHRFESHEIAITEETAERTWAAVERARAEAALRESEERFQQFAKASAAGLWIRNAETLEMEFVSPSVGTIYGVAPDTLLGDVKRWATMILPDDRDAALEHLRTARTGGTVMHEFRIQRSSDKAFRWVRNTDFPLRDDGHVARVGGIAEDITETRQLTEHRGVLLAELQHRVRNIMAMIRSMANRTAPGARDVEDYRSLLEGRLLALARVQVLLTREANAGASLSDIIESEVTAQAHEGGQFELSGPEIALPPKAVEVLTLAFHELATNALKYGALSIPDGRLAVSWAPFEKRGTPWLALDWSEDGAPPREPSSRRGFGSELIEGRIPYELGGTGRIIIGPRGARCHLEFPLKQAESILETDAPQPATIFGGTLDMTGAPDLTGRKVLIVEDDYYLASDTAAALRGAGADVLSPCPNEDATLDLLEHETPTHAVLDLNLGGGGPRFDIAELLRRRGVPFLFLTGYDPNVIPSNMADVVRLQKPVPFRAIVEKLGQL